MKKLKKVLLYTLGIFFFLVLVLAVHIYYVYRPKADATTKVMARIDIKQPVTQEDANKFTSWMSHQRGVDHVVVNAENRNIVFTFFPVKVTGDQITKNFKSVFNINAERFMPSSDQLKSSCPAAPNSLTYKAYKVISNII